VEPERQIDAPTGCCTEPVTWMFCPLWPLTYGVEVQLLFAATQAVSRPGNVEAWKVPWATWL
jgi:hypothetical protein